MLSENEKNCSLKHILLFYTIMATCVLQQSIFREIYDLFSCKKSTQISSGDMESFS